MRSAHYAPKIISCELCIFSCALHEDTSDIIPMNPFQALIQLLPHKAFSSVDFLVPPFIEEVGISTATVTRVIIKFEFYLSISHIELFQKFLAIYRT